MNGFRFGFAAAPQTMAFAQRLLPPEAVRAGGGFVRMAYPMLAQAWLPGGHLRIGMEDMARISRGVLAPDRAWFARRAARTIDDLGSWLAASVGTRRIRGPA